MQKSTVSTKTLLTLIAPAALVVSATAGALLLAPDAPLLVQAGKGYPLVALALTLLLAWRLQRSRLFISALALALTTTLLDTTPLGGDAVANAGAAIALPLGLVLLALTADRPVSAPRSQLQLLLALGPGIALAGALAARRSAVAPYLHYDVLGLGGGTTISQPALLAGALAIVVVAILAVRRRLATDAGLAWAVLTSVLALATPAGSIARELWVLATGVILVIALIEASYVMAFHDELTALPGRRALNQLLASVRAPYTVAVIDVDRFKTFNDRYGHEVGDQVLRMVASKLAAVGGGGKPFRSGGEEFTIVFPGRTKVEALPHVQAVRAAVEDAKFTLRTPPRPRGRNAAAARGSKRSSARQIGVTISAGLAAFGASSATAQAVMKSADKAMYRAKKNGRNRVVA